MIDTDTARMLDNFGLFQFHVLWVSMNITGPMVWRRGGLGASPSCTVNRVTQDRAFGKSEDCSLTLVTGPIKLFCTTSHWPQPSEIYLLLLKAVYVRRTISSILMTIWAKICCTFLAGDGEWLL